MIDPLLAAAGTAALTQGVTFLYNQAGDLLTRRRELRARAEESSGAPDTAPADALPLLVVPDGVFAAPAAKPAAVVPELLEQHVEQLRIARRGVEDYVLGDGGVDLGVPAVRQALEDLRCALETVYRTDLTFAQERRDTSPGSAAQSSGQRGGVTVGGSVHAGRDVAMRDIHHVTHVADR